MAVKIQVKRGTKAGLPALAPGEFGLTTDTFELYIGTSNGNKQLGTLELSDGRYLKLSGGSLTGNLTGKNITGTRLQSTEDNHMTSKASKVCVQDGSGWLYYRTLAELLADLSAVPTTRKVNNKALSGDITLTSGDVGAVPTSRKVNNKPLSADITLGAGDVGAVPTSRKVNNKALSSDITLAAGDVGAVPTSRTVNGKALSSNITLNAGDVNAAPAYTYGTEDLTAGSSTLATGTLYFMYEL